MCHASNTLYYMLQDSRTLETCSFIVTNDHFGAVTVTLSLSDISCESRSSIMHPESLNEEQLRSVVQGPGDVEWRYASDCNHMCN
jgi:hypothetical protein